MRVLLPCVLPEVPQAEAKAGKVPLLSVVLTSICPPVQVHLSLCLSMQPKIDS